MKCLPTQRLVPGFFVGTNDQKEDRKVVKDSSFECVIKESVITKKSGLNNLGNSCFMNSIIQCLAYTSGFEYFVQHLPNKLYDSNIGKPMFLHHLSELFKAMSSLSTVAPHVFYANLHNICSGMKAGEQQDANEFLLALLNRFEDECGPNNNVVRSYFGGELTDLVQCQSCGHSIRRSSSFLDISLPNNGKTVEECFDNLMNSVSEQNTLKCEHCGKKGTSLSKQVLSKSPDVLIVTMMRFSTSGCRVQNSAEFDFTLDLSKYSEDGASDIYELYGVVNHSGHHINRGHFSSFVKTSDGQWYHSDDSKVHPETSEAVLQAKPYILFYKRQKPLKVRFGVTKDVAASRNKLSKSVSEPNTFLAGLANKVALSAGV